MALGTAAYLSLPARGRLVPGHAVIAPAEHLPSIRGLDEVAWTEVKNFIKCLVRMWGVHGQAVLFMETSMRTAGGRHHAVLDAVPMSERQLEKARCGGGARGAGGGRGRPACGLATVRRAVWGGVCVCKCVRGQCDGRCECTRVVARLRRCLEGLCGCTAGARSGYFKKAILEAESEWSTHHAKACIEITAQKVRPAAPSLAGPHKGQAEPVPARCRRRPA